MGLIDNIGGNGATVALQIAVALSLLMLGRRLYWLFVAGVGFVVTLALAAEYIDFGPEWMALALGIVAGIAGALFAIFLQKLAVGMAGFAASAYFAYEVAGRLGVEGNMQTVGVLVAGALGAIFASVLFDWALILLSSVAGAVLLVDTFVLDDMLALIVMTVLAIAGVAIQSNMMHREDKE